MALAQKVSLLLYPGRKLFSHRNVNIWNSLPSHIAQAPSVATFKGRLGAFDFPRFNSFYCVFFCILMFSCFFASRRVFVFGHLLVQTLSALVSLNVSSWFSSSCLSHCLVNVNWLIDWYKIMFSYRQNLAFLKISTLNHIWLMYSHNLSALPVPVQSCDSDTSPTYSK